MPMNPAGLADEIKSAAGQSGPTSPENLGMAAAIIEEIVTMGIVSFAPGTIMGVCPSGGPLSNGSGQAGLIIGPTGPTLAAKMAQKMGKGAPSPQLIGMATGITTHLLTAQVSFKPGGIAGTCGNSPTSPGPFVGAGSGGTIAGMVGSAMAQLVATGMGQPAASPELSKVCGAIVDHIQKNAQVMFAMGLVLGTCPPGGGPLTLGAAAGGKIS